MQNKNGSQPQQPRLSKEVPIRKDLKNKHHSTDHKESNDENSYGKSRSICFATYFVTKFQAHNTTKPKLPKKLDVKSGQQPKKW